MNKLYVTDYGDLVEIKLQHYLYLISRAEFCEIFQLEIPYPILDLDVPEYIFFTDLTYNDFEKRSDEFRHKQYV